MSEDLKSIKRQLFDQEDGLIIRVNKNTEFRKKTENVEKDFIRMQDEHKSFMSWKDTVNRVLWIIFTAITGIIVALIFGQTASH
jgi:CRISPR/Cas system-associated protein Cas5 (RAMP superfamily)